MPGYIPRDEAPKPDERAGEVERPPAKPEAKAPPEWNEEDVESETQVQPGSSVEYGDSDTPSAPPASPPRRVEIERTVITRTPTEAPPVAAPAPPAVAPPSQGALQTIPLGDPKSYYLIDRNRALCFLYHQDTVTEVDCSKIPEARDLAPAPRQPEPAPAAPAPAMSPMRRGPGAATPVAPTPEPAPAPAPAAPAPATRTAPAPAPAGATSPTPDELVRFEAAYVDIFCDRREGATTAPKERIEGQGLSVTRYGAIEEWWAGDQAAWWSLVNKARRACGEGSK